MLVFRAKDNLLIKQKDDMFVTISLCLYYFCLLSFILIKSTIYYCILLVMCALSGAFVCYVIYGFS